MSSLFLTELHEFWANRQGVGHAPTAQGFLNDVAPGRERDEPCASLNIVHVGGARKTSALLA